MIPDYMVAENDYPQHQRGEIHIMGVKNYLVEGVSGTGKTAVCHALRHRGYAAINGDRELAYQGDPITGESLDDAGDDVVSAERRHAQHLWDVDKVRRLAENNDDEMTFFCGGSRNFAQFITVFDAVFILDIDAATLAQRLDQRAEDDWGKRDDERRLILQLHATKADLPQDGIIIDATQPLTQVVDAILKHVML